MIAQPDLFVIHRRNIGIGHGTILQSTQIRTYISCLSRNKVTIIPGRQHIDLITRKICSRICESDSGPCLRYSKHIGVHMVFICHYGAVNRAYIALCPCDFQLSTIIHESTIRDNLVAVQHCNKFLVICRYQCCIAA